jgi:hypothetical protein
LTNRSSFPTQLTELSFAWRLAFHPDKEWTATPLDFDSADKEVPHRNFPITLSPNTPQLFYLYAASTGKEELLPILNDARFGRRTAAKLLRARVFVGFRSFPVTLHSSFRRELKVMLARTS